jgi:hypothetical protein
MRMMAFDALLLGSCFYAQLRGGAPERIVALALCTAYAATLRAYSAPLSRFDHVEIAVLMIDALLFLVLATVALRADRGWPLAVAGLHLATVGAHLAKFFDVNMIRVTYAVMIAMWSYPMLILLAIGTWRHRRRLKAHGHDQDWILPSASEDSLATARALAASAGPHISGEG